jgi:hypothetical protein
MSTNLTTYTLDVLRNQIREAVGYIEYAADLIDNLDLPDDEEKPVWVDPELHSALRAAYGQSIDLHNELRDVTQELAS